MLLWKEFNNKIGKMIRFFEFQDKEDLDESNSWSGTLSAVYFPVISTFHTTTRVISMKLIFGRDVMLNNSFDVNWKHIEDRKRNLIESNNKREKSKRLIHEYQEGDSVLIKQA